MFTLIVLAFILGYLTIVFEHPLKLDKTVPALLMGAFMWALLAVGFYQGSVEIIDSHNHIFSLMGGGDHLEAEEGFTGALLHHLGK
ncbi:MAG: sodium:proton antiporter, partial [Saprospiraceae bacterium]|nr:sodium:proton antiporter [Saprospiraceae bacterium]